MAHMGESVSRSRPTCSLQSYFAGCDERYLTPGDELLQRDRGDLVMLAEGTRVDDSAELGETIDEDACGGHALDEVAEELHLRETTRMLVRFRRGRAPSSRRRWRRCRRLWEMRRCDDTRPGQDLE